MSEENDQVRLRHMLEYAREVTQFTQGKTRSDLNNDVLLDRALRYSIGIIGEAAAHLSEEFRDAHPAIPWSDIIGMRNFLFHIYHRVESNILWRTATESIPALVVWIEPLLKEDSSDQTKNE
ncbi:MAG: DUF86 domain-containing protein [Chloroflexi bacterium]|nr:DUF86 domain-containing protein [Chloroflexota bacterium]